MQIAYQSHILKYNIALNDTLITYTKLINLNAQFFKKTCNGIWL